MSDARLLILCPVLDDWDSLFTLISQLDQSLVQTGVRVSVLAVNDGPAGPPTVPQAARGGRVEGVQVLNLNCSLGHQRAIAVGLAYAIHECSFDAVVIMDSDGEDRPQDVASLWAAYVSDPARIVVARRQKRSEGLPFVFAYGCYRLLFRLLTGRSIRFGNFCLMSRDNAARMVHYDWLWNHLPATVLRSAIALTEVPTARGRRYSGESRMNPAALVLHGLSAISVFSDIAIMRVVAAAVALTLLTVGGMIAVVAVRFTTDLAIPGWASTVFGSLSVILVQCVVISVLLLFMVLGARSQRTFIPARDFREYVRSTEPLFPDYGHPIPR